MRRLFPGVIALTFVALIGGTADAQIRLVPGPPRIVAQAPKFITASDFNLDGFEDAAVTNTTSNKITVLLGQESGTTFGSVLDFSIGRTLRGLQAGDLNNDGKPDIAVADFIDAKVFTALGNGTGTFDTPIPYKVGRYAFDVAIGNFDGKNGNDLAVVDQGINKVSILLNLGGNKGFPTTAPVIDVGKKPKRVVAADFNGDGLDDLVTVNTGTSAADDISLLLNNGVGGFITPPRNFVVGAGAVDVAVADFNNDGVLDLAVLNAGLVATQTTFSVSILLDQTQIVDGKRVGTGFFTNEPAVQLNCPASINGVPILCRPNFIAAGDLDNDGFNDLAITIFTHPRDNVTSISTSGLVAAFQGAGDGTFNFAEQVTVGINPQGIVAGDFNGDGIADLAIAETGSLSVRIIDSLPPPLRSGGDTCHLGHQCASGSCVDGVCCGSVSCPAGQFCDIPTSPGICTLPEPGGRCTDGHQCASAFCVDGFCCESRVCGTGLFCNTGVCAPPADLGAPCNSNNESGGDDQCASGHCTDGVCCAEDRCPAAQSCNIPGFEGACLAKLPNGTACTVDAQCEPSADSLVGFCTDGFCCEMDQCPAGQSCAIHPAEGLCRLAPTPSPTMTLTPTFTPTPTPRPPQPTGSPCSSGSECITGACTDNVCCGQNPCPAGQFCDISGSPGSCMPQGGTGHGCQSDHDCASGNCQGAPSGSCQGTRTPTPTVTPHAGSQCGSSADCTNPAFSVCSTSNSEFVCCHSDCQAGSSCLVTDKIGTCTLLPTATPTETPLPEPGSRCTTGDQCGSTFCVDGRCCDQESCAPGELCNIFGSEGQCFPPLDQGEPCEKNSDCNALLDCELDPLQGFDVCTVPVLTPTFGPTKTPTVVGGPSFHSSSSGGCSINNGTDGGGLVLLAALPLIYGIRRSRLQRIRVKARARRRS